MTVLARQPASQPTFPAQWHVIKRFDFDEAHLGNEGDVPMYWFRFKGAGFPDFPRYAAGRWDRGFGYNSQESFRLSLDGGNVGYFYQPNTIAILPGQDVRIEARVRTGQLKHARAMIEVSLNDARGEMVSGSRRRSELIGGPGQNDRWHFVVVNIPGKFATARYVNLSVFLLQPNRWRMLDPLLADRPNLIDYTDVRGDAWFDDLTVCRLPRVSMTTGAAGQLLGPTSRPAIHIEVEGFSNQPLEAELSVHDLADRLIARELFTSASGGDRAIRSFQWKAAPLPPGLYRAELGLYAGGTRAAGLPALLTRKLVFAQLPATPPRPARGHGFGLVLPNPPADLDESAARALASEQADALAQMPITMVKLPLWRSELDVAALEHGDMWTDEIVRRMVRQRIALVGVFGEMPAPLATAAQAAADPAGAKLGMRRSLLDVFSGQATAWRPFIASHLARYADQIGYWQIGQEDDVAFALDPRFAAAMDSVHTEFRRLLTSPTFVATWPAMYSYRKPAGEAGSPTPAPSPEKFPARVANLFMSNRATSAALLDHVNDFAGLTETRPWATVQPPEAAALGRQARLADLAWRLTTASAGLAEPLPPAVVRGSSKRGVLFMTAPWTVRDASGTELVEPTEDMLVFRNVADLLSGARYGGQIALADGVVGHIFDRGDGTGTMAILNATSQPASVDMYFGEKPERVDLWGHRQPLTDITAEDSAGPCQRLVVGALPCFVDGIEPRLARLRASLKLDPPFVPSAYRKHTRQIAFTNTFATPISGKMTLHFPDNWDVHPKIIPFSVQAGQTFTRDVDIRFPYNAEAGGKLLRVDFVLDADRTYEVQMATRFDFGLGDVEVTTLTQWIGGDELQVTMNVVNKGDSRLDAFCFVVAADQPRQERVIAGLPTGGAAAKSFRIPQAKALVGKSIRVGLREIRGSRIVNYDVPIR